MFKVKLIVSITIALFIVACGGSNNASVNNQNNLAPVSNALLPLTDDINYTKQQVSASNGSIDLTEELILEGYIAADTVASYIIEVKDQQERLLPNMNIYYWIDKNTNIIRLKIEDPTQNLATLYQQESITDILNSAAKNKYAYNPGLIIRLLSIIIRGNTIRNLTNTALTSYQLFNIYTHYQDIKEEEVYEGSIADFYPVFASLAAIRKLPFTLKSNTKKTDGIITATGLIRFTSNNINHELLTYLKQLTANENLDETAIIRVNTVSLDGTKEMLTIELDQENEIDTSSGSFYDINISVNGHRDHAFDGTLFSVAPELRAKIIIGSLTYDVLSGATGYSSHAVLSNVPLKQGDEVEVIVYDDDVLSLEEINRFTFTFDGSRQLSENDISTTTLNFTALNVDSQPDNTPKYNIDLTIEGDQQQNPDEGHTLPDFAGELFIAGNRYVIEKKNNTLVNRQVLKDIPINIGDSIRVTIVEEDVLWPPEMISKFRFDFTGNDYVEENDKAMVLLKFITE